MPRKEKPGTHMNYMALHQNILGKTLRFGIGPTEGTETTPYRYGGGPKLYLNGRHEMPEHEPLTDLLTIGTLYHPAAMTGMPTCGGDITYELGITPTEYLIVVRLQLDEDVNGPSDEAADLLALIKREDLLEDTPDQDGFYGNICLYALLPHMESLLAGYASVDDLHDWVLNDDLVAQAIHYHFRQKAEGK